MVENSKYKMINQGFDGSGAVIEPRARRNDMRAGPCESQHVFQMDSVVGRLARDEDELAALLQANVGGAVNEICAASGRDGSKGSH